jgi:hypothetical protein
MLMRITSRVRLEESAAASSNKSSNKFSRAFKEEKLLRHPFFKACHRRSRDFLVRNVLAAVPSIEERYSKDDDEGNDVCGCVGARGGARCVTPCCRHADDDVVVVKNRRISGWNFNEDNLEFDPTTEEPAAAAEKRCLPFEDPVELDDSDSTGDGDKRAPPQPPHGYDDHDHDHGKAAEAIGFKQQQQQQVVTRQLMAVLKSLEMRRDMVTNVLQRTAGRFDDVDVDSGNDGACGESVTTPREEREEMLLGYVRQLEHRVEDLRKEVDEEMAWNARLEKMLQERVVISNDEKKINSSHTSAGSS